MAEIKYVKGNDVYPQDNDVYPQDNDVPPSPSSRAMEVAALAWCSDQTKDIEMDHRLAMEFAKIIDQYREALIWCSGSSDFGIKGQARKGWERLVSPLIG